MNLGWALIALALVTSSLSFKSDTQQIDDFIEAELPNSVVPGIVYARIEGGEVMAKGFGARSKRADGEVTSETQFPIGSVTKSFTALAVMQQIEAGAFGLDDPVSQVLPAFSAGPASEVTMRQLLNHTSGYSTVQGNSHHGNADASQLGLTEYAELLALVVPAHPPGAVWEYSNANYQILGAVIEQASGTSYADYIDQRIFKPLGMTNSIVVIGADPPTMATGHRPWFGGVRASPGGKGFPINAPAGGIMASADDMGRYLAMWLNGEDDVVLAETKAIMVAPSGPASPTYGLGWSIDPALGTVYHTGLVPGGEALASFSPEGGKGVAVMVNANGGLGFADTWYLIGGVGARALGQDHTDDGSRWGPKGAYLSIALLPPFFLMAMIFAFRFRTQLRAKRESLAGRFSLWFPLVAMLGLAWFLIAVLPQLFGGSLATLRIYQPDFAWCMIAAAIMAPAWAVFRLALAYSNDQSVIANG